MEVAARLLLQPNGHFKYELAYGPHDETAGGTWDVQGGSVFLTTVPDFKSPHFSVIGDQVIGDQRNSPSRTLRPDIHGH